MGGEINRGKALRREVDTGVKLKILETDSDELKSLVNNWMESRTHDISEKALTLYTSIYIPDGTQIEAELESSPFYTNKKGLMHILGKVIFSSKAGDKFLIGLQFAEISEEDRKAIINYLK